MKPDLCAIVLSEEARKRLFSANVHESTVEFLQLFGQILKRHEQHLQNVRWPKLYFSPSNTFRSDDDTIPEYFRGRTLPVITVMKGFGSFEPVAYYFFQDETGAYYSCEQGDQHDKTQ